jgi:hypothetical protein
MTRPELAASPILSSWWLNSLHHCCAKARTVQAETPGRLALPRFSKVFFERWWGFGAFVPGILLDGDRRY